MDIKSIKLNQGGLKGCLVKFMGQRLDESNKVTYNDTNSTDTPAPVTQKMRDLFEQLTEYFRDLLCFDEDADIQVSQVISNGTDWQLTGTVIAANGVKTGIAGPNVREANDYAQSQEVLDVIAQIYKEVKKYLGGKGKIDAKQVVMEMKEVDGKKFEKLLLKAGLVEADLAKLEDKRDAMRMMRLLLEADGDIIISKDDFEDDKKVRSVQPEAITVPVDNSELQEDFAADRVHELAKVS